MTQEDKELLLKDLCSRLPYLENWVRYDGKDYVITGYGHGRVSLLSSMFSSGVGPCPLVEEVKPYLRPMSSMTGEEENFYYSCLDEMDGYKQTFPVIYQDKALSLLDWLNAHHFNYRLPPHLFIEAPEGMYKTE